MIRLKNILPEIVLFTVSAGIYFCYFPQVFLQPNSILSGITGDALKNYYTYFYHIQNDNSWIEFNGMNFPFGEHAVYTDCQPLLTWLMKLLPFARPYSIGILHYLLFLSFAFSTVIFFRIFRRLGIVNVPSSMCALAITLLSPQLQKIAGGHHGLAYGFMLPLNILLTLNYIQLPLSKNIWILLTYNFLLFFIHPYIGFAASLFSLISILIFSIRHPKRLRVFVASVVTGFLPLLLFRAFMLITDKHTDRTKEPFGQKTLLENFDSLVAPDFGPFQKIMENIFSNKIPHLESHSYLGFFILVLSVACAIFYLIRFRKITFSPELLPIFFAALFLLFLSFGWHSALLEKTGAKINALNQFRAACRFGWTFYYILPIFLFCSLQQNLQNKSLKKGGFITLSVLYLLLNFWEANSYFKKDKDNFWTYRNFLNEQLLTETEKNIIETIRESNAQAIVPLPVFHIGSETFARQGGDMSMIPAMLYSFHSKLPILSVAMSRTSVSETRQSLDLLNAYHRNKIVSPLLSEKDFLILKTKDELLPDEIRLWEKSEPKSETEEFQIATISKKRLLNFSSDTSYKPIPSQLESLTEGPTVFISDKNSEPFSSSRLEDYKTIYVLDSSLTKSGEYVLSYHFHSESAAEGACPDLIVAKRTGTEFHWEHYFSGRVISGFYPDYLVFEKGFRLEKGSSYEFVLKGGGDAKYHISHFMLRPADKNILVIQQADTLYNNFAP